MKRFPDSDEWNRIVDAAFSSEEEHIFSDRYNERKGKMISGLVMKKRINRKRLTGIFAAGAAFAVLVPTTVYAYSRYNAAISKTAKYQNTITIEPVNQTAESTEKSANKKIQLMKCDFGWMPEGYIRSEKGYSNKEAGGQITTIFYRIPDDKLKNGTSIDIDYTDNFEKYETNGNTAMINYRVSYSEGDTDNFGREIWVIFNDTNYLLQIYPTDDVSRGDTLKMLDNIKLVPTDEICFSTYLPWLDKTEHNVDYSSERRPVDEEKINMKHIGETGSYNSDEFMNCDITVNSVEITDSLAGIHTDPCGNEKDYSQIADENGNILENTRTWIKAGDRINTIDEVVSEENIPLHILKVNATFTNNLDKTEDYCICPELFTFNDGVPEVVWQHDEESGLDYNDSLHDAIEGDYNRHFAFDTDPDKKGSKNHVILEPGESADVELAFLVSDDTINNAYLNFYVIGNSLSSSINNGYPVFDIMQ